MREVLRSGTATGTFLACAGSLKAAIARRRTRIIIGRLAVMENLASRLLSGAYENFELCRRLRSQSNPPVSLFKGGFFSAHSDPSLKKHALSEVEGRGKGRFLSQEFRRPSFTRFAL